MQMLSQLLSIILDMSRRYSYQFKTNLREFIKDIQIISKNKIAG
jgi:hypothetical protein